jgi:hypothetical protein
MSFLRHIGKIGDRKVAVIFRELPNESHMCLVVYTEILNAHIHDALMRCIEGDVGQNSENLADALNRSYTTDGRVLLHTLHNEGLLKKVRTEQVVMTPTPSTRIKLDELNKILDEMKQGEAAVKRLAELDSSAGLQDPADVARRMRGQTNQPAKGNAGALDDSTLAQQRLDQATKMEREANGLLAEAKRLKDEALAMNPALAPKKVTKSKATKAEVVATTSKAKKVKNVA